MTRSKQERMPVILSVCLTQKGCSVEIAGTAYSPRLVALRTTIILRRDAVFTSSFGCGRAAVCIAEAMAAFVGDGGQGVEGGLIGIADGAAVRQRFQRDVAGAVSGIRRGLSQRVGVA